jgi:hypothetical protein
MVFWHLDHIQLGFIFIVVVSEEDAFWVDICDADMSEHLQYWLRGSRMLVAFIDHALYSFSTVYCYS